MDIKLFSLCNQEAASAQDGKKYIKKCVTDFFPECGDFIPFSSQKRMLVAISQSLLAADIVVVAVQSTMYNTTKRMLAAALDMKLEQNQDVAKGLAPALAANKIKANTYAANISFPVTAEIFVTNSFINCGFAITSGGQHIIYLPIDDEKAQEIVFGSLYDYLGDLVDTYVRDSAMIERHKMLINRAAAHLKKESLTVAMANINGKDLILKYAGNNELLKTCFVFENDYNKRSDDAVREYIANTSRQVMDVNKTNLGVVISNAYSGDDSSVFMYISVSDAKGTKVIKMFAEESEKASDLVSACIDKLMIMLYDYNEDSEDNDYVHDDSSDKSLRKLLTVLTAASVGVAAILGLIVTLISK
jgi:hypothetical protein